MPEDWQAKIEIGANTIPAKRRPVTSAVDTTELFGPIEQYMLQGEEFSKRVRTGSDSMFPLEDALENMKVIDALFRSAKSQSWEIVNQTG